MININELRIGNWVESVHPDFKEGYFQVWSISQPNHNFFKLELDSQKLDQHIHSVDLSYINPILLTESILLKIGFEKHENTFYSELFIFNNDTIRILADNYATTGKDVQVKYLHQLQNLYFVLKHKEIKLKL